MSQLSQKFSEPAQMNNLTDNKQQTKETDGQSKTTSKANPKNSPDQEKKIQDHEEEKHDLKDDDSELALGNIDGVKIAVIGNVDSGKSTLVGVLTKGITDDGRGSARLKVFNYAHEATNGRTSSIGHEIMGFDDNGKQMFAERFVPNKNKYWAEVVKKSSKIVTLLDLCGHEKYLKTTMFGLVGMVPDYSMIIIGANMGISRMTKEHLGITLALQIPFFIIITKIDMCPENVYKETMETLTNILRSQACNRLPIQIKGDEEINTCSKAIATDRICPIFCVSSVTGQGVDQLVKFISLLKNRNKINKQIKSKDDMVEYDINENFMVSGVGIVVSGICKSGTIKSNMTLLLGPDKANGYKPVSVKSIHVNRVSAEEAVAGQFACLAIRPHNKKDSLNRDEMRKGMVLIDPNLKPVPIWEFEAEISVLHHATTIKKGYQSVMHCGVIRQAVSIEELPLEALRTGDRGACVRFRFMYNSEYLKPDQIILLREGRTKIIGVVTRVFDNVQKKVTEEKKEPEKKEELKVNVEKKEADKKEDVKKVEGKKEPEKKEDVKKKVDDKKEDGVKKKDEKKDDTKKDDKSSGKKQAIQNL